MMLESTFHLNESCLMIWFGIVGVEKEKPKWGLILGGSSGIVCVSMERGGLVFSIEHESWVVVFGRSNPHRFVGR
jgi:hypothetical protein